MIIQTDAGMDAIISLFEEGWTAGFTKKEENPPSYMSPSMLEFWHDGYAAGVADSAADSAMSSLFH
jgi:hypothetical protein